MSPPRKPWHECLRRPSFGRCARRGARSLPATRLRPDWCALALSQPLQGRAGARGDAASRCHPSPAPRGVEARVSLACLDALRGRPAGGCQIRRAAALVPGRREAHQRGWHAGKCACASAHTQYARSVPHEPRRHSRAPSVRSRLRRRRPGGEGAAQERPPLEEPGTDSGGRASPDSSAANGLWRSWVQLCCGQARVRKEGEGLGGCWRGHAGGDAPARAAGRGLRYEAQGASRALNRGRPSPRAAAAAAAGARGGSAALAQRDALHLDRGPLAARRGGAHASPPRRALRPALCPDAAFRSPGSRSSCQRSSCMRYSSRCSRS